MLPPSLSGVGDPILAWCVPAPGEGFPVVLVPNTNTLYLYTNIIDLVYYRNCMEVGWFSSVIRLLPVLCIQIHWNWIRILKFGINFEKKCENLFGTSTKIMAVEESSELLSGSPVFSPFLIRIWMHIVAKYLRIQFGSGSTTLVVEGAVL